MIRHRRSLLAALTPAALVRAVGALLLVVGIVTCRDQALGPSPVLGSVAVAPVFPSGQFVGGNLPIDHVHAVVVRPAEPTKILRDITKPFSLNVDALNLKLDLIPLESPAESLDVTIELLSGTTVLFRATQRLEAAAGPAPAPAPLLPLTFVGPGSQLAALFLAPLDSTLTQGDNLPMRVSGEDASQLPVPNFYVSWSTSDTNVARVNGDGRVTGKVPRGVVYVRARTPATTQAPAGVVESTTVTLVPAPATILKASGDLQSGTVGQPLPLPLVVQVVASDQQGIAGVTVTFTPPAGGSVLPTSAVTDVNGMAQTTATMPASGTGQVNFTASAAGVAAVSFAANFAATPSPTWTGAVSTDWDTPGNWSLGAVPTSADSVTVPSGPSNQPLVSVTNATVGALLNNGTITLGTGAAITAFGNVRGSGSIVGGGATGALVMPLAGTTLVLPTVPNVLISAAVTLGGNVTVVGQLNIAGSGDLNFGNHTANVSSSFSTTGTATITMTNPLDTLKVAGAVLFDGGSTFGKISSGVIFVGGDFDQAATTSIRSYAPTGNHIDVFTGTGVQTVTFVSPGASGSNFETLVLANPAGGVTLGGDIFQAGPVGFATGVPRIVHGGGHTVFVAELIASRVTLDNVLIVANNVQITQFDSITFNNNAPTATPLTIVHPGALVPFAFHDLVFNVTPSTGFYISVTDNAPADGNPLTINMVNPTPGTPANFVQTGGGAVVNWPSGGPAPAMIWTGAVSTDWSDPGNWSTNAVPTFADSVEIPAGGNQPTLTTTSFAGAVHLANGTLTLGGQGLGVVSTFITTGSGRLVMTDPNDALSISGNAIFDGANELNFLSAGQIAIGGDLTQLATNSPDSYHPSGTQVTALIGNNPTVTFATPGLIPGSSHFQDVLWGGIGTLTLGSQVLAHGEFLASNGSPTTIQGSGVTLGAGGFFTAGQALTIDGVELEITNTGTGTVGLANVSFINQNPAGDQLTIHHPGASGSIITSNVSFATVPTTGHYLVADDNAPADGLVLTIDMQNPTPGTPGSFVQTLGGAIVNWPAAGGGGNGIWTGTNGTNWNDPGNWQGGQVPAAGADILMGAGAPNYPQLISGETVNDLFLAAGATITNIDGSLDVGGDLSGGGTFVGGGLTLSGSGKTLDLASSGDIQVTGQITLMSSLDITSGGITIFGPGASLDVNGNGLTTASDLQTVSGGVLIMTTAGAQVEVGGTTIFDGGDETGLLSAGLLLVEGDFIQTNTSSDSSFVATGTFHVTLASSAAAQTITMSDSTTSFFQDLTLSGPANVIAGSIIFVRGNLDVASGVQVSANDVTFTGGGFSVLGNVTTAGGNLLQTGRLYVGGVLSFNGTWNQTSVIFTGTGQTAPSNLPYQFFYSTGTVTLAPGNASMGTLTTQGGTLTLGGRTTVNDVFLETGTLKPNNHTLVVVGALQSLSTGTLTMQNPLDSVLVTGAGIFGGGSTVGLMTDGVLRFGGSFSQTSGTSTTSFAASGNHKTLLGSAAVKVVNFASPGTGAGGSHFGNLEVTAASGGLTLNSNIVADGALISLPTGTAPTITGGGKTVTAMSLGVTIGAGTSLILDNAPLIVNEQGTIRAQQFDRAHFQGFATSATLMDMTMVGTALTPRAVTFQAPFVQTSVTNLYAKLVSSNAQGVTVTINGSNDPTGGPSKSNPPFGTTVNGARIVWQ